MMQYIGVHPPLTAENGITDICSAVFAFSVTNNVTKTLFKKQVICRKLQVSPIDIFLPEQKRKYSTALITASQRQRTIMQSHYLT